MRELKSVSRSTRALRRPTSITRPTRPRSLTAAMPLTTPRSAPASTSTVCTNGPPASATTRAVDRGRRRDSGLEIEQLAQRGVLQRELPRLVLPLEQALVLVAQMRVLLAQGEQLADLGGGPARGVDRLDHRAQHRHDRVADPGADRAEQPRRRPCRPAAGRARPRSAPRTRSGRAAPSAAGSGVTANGARASPEISVTVPSAVARRHRPAARRRSSAAGARAVDRRNDQGCRADKGSQPASRADGSSRRCAARGAGSSSPPGSGRCRARRR